MPQRQIKPNRTEPIPRSCLLKVPSQGRSIDMVHHIMDVAIDELETNGAHSLNTNRIAEEAGISTGSLYQYFANKDMIVGAIIERALLDSQHVLRAAMQQAIHMPPKMLMEAGIQLMLHNLRPYKKVMREIFISQPMLSETSVPAVIESSLLDILRDYLLINQDKYRLDGGLAAMHIAVNTMIFMFLRWTVDPPTGISEEEFINALINQVTSALVEV